MILFLKISIVTIPRNPVLTAKFAYHERNPPSRRAPGIPRADQTHRADLQSGLPLLFLSGEAETLPGGKPVAHERRRARGIHPPIYRGTTRTGDLFRLAGRRADALGRGVFCEG